MGKAMSRLGGGIGTRGPGESKLESDRRHIRSRIDKLRRDLEQVRQVRSVQRRQRKKAELPLVAIVGYTNAGKSTLLNTLTGAGIEANDRLFDTLDPTTRKKRISDTQEILLSDTVGFIRKLPHHLVSAFKATLEELAYADLLLHVVDVSDENWQIHAQTVDKVVAQLGAQERRLRPRGHGGSHPAGVDGLRGPEDIDPRGRVGARGNDNGAQMTPVRGHVQNPARLLAIATRAPDDKRGCQDGAHRGAFDARHVGAQLVACSGRCLEQPLCGQTLHDGGERVGHRS